MVDDQEDEKECNEGLKADLYIFIPLPGLISPEPPWHPSSIPNHDLHSAGSFWPEDQLQTLCIQSL